jgi:hypothetical protein
MFRITAPIPTPKIESVVNTDNRARGESEFMKCRNLVNIALLGFKPESGSAQLEAAYHPEARSPSAREMPGR